MGFTKQKDEYTEQDFLTANKAARVFREYEKLKGIESAYMGDLFFTGRDEEIVYFETGFKFPRGVDLRSGIFDELLLDLETLSNRLSDTNFEVTIDLRNIRQSSMSSNIIVITMIEPL